MADRMEKEVRALAQSALADSPIHDLRGLQVQQRNGDLIISGSVSRFYHKQLAQEIVLSCCKGGGVVNSIFVR